MFIELDWRLIIQTIVHSINLNPKLKISINEIRIKFYCNMNS